MTRLIRLGGAIDVDTSGNLKVSEGKIEAMNGATYNKIDTLNKTEVGVIAQEVQEVLPEAVSVIDPESGYLGVSYNMLMPVLIEAVKELKTENDALKSLVCEDHPEALICL